MIVDNTEALRKLREEILSDKHPQFVFNREQEQVKCRCGHNAVWWKTGFICGTITAYPCKYNKIKHDQ